jgi:hypothetical protein
MEYDAQGRPVKVAEPTHYQHLANGRVVPGYAGGTHHSEPGDNEGDPDKLTPIVQSYQG